MSCIFLGQYPRETNRTLLVWLWFILGKYAMKKGPAVWNCPTLPEVWTSSLKTVLHYLASILCNSYLSKALGTIKISRYEETYAYNFFKEFHLKWNFGDQLNRLWTKAVDEIWRCWEEKSKYLFNSKYLRDAPSNLILNLST